MARPVAFCREWLKKFNIAGLPGDLFSQTYSNESRKFPPNFNLGNIPDPRVEFERLSPYLYLLSILAYKETHIFQQDPWLTSWNDA